MDALIKLRLHRFYQWRGWCDNHTGILLGGLEQSRYQQFRDEYRADYDEIAHLVEFCYTNARNIEGDKA